jgi:hypothetical protein
LYSELWEKTPKKYGNCVDERVTEWQTRTFEGRVGDRTGSNSVFRTN